MLDERQRARVFKIIIVTQCLGMITTTLFQNGFYLNYFAKLGISSATIAMLFALPFLVGSILMLPFAFISDRFGKKGFALFGQVLLVASLALMISAGWMGNGRLSLSIVVVSLLVFSVGGTLQAAGWFALLNPIVPAETRGRFFGRLRVTFQTVSIVVTLLITRLLKASQAMPVFQGILGLILVAAVLRYFTYARIPELENAGGEKSHRGSFRDALATVLSAPGYLHFNAYVFLVTLFTAAVPTVFGLMQKDVFGFTPAQISLVGALFLVGGVAGCGLGGRVVDRYGNRVVFVLAQLAFAASMLAMLARHWVPWPLLAHAGLCTIVFSMVGGMVGVAISTEMLALIPPSNKSLSTAFTMMLSNGGIALAGIGVSKALGWRIFPPEWHMLGRSFTAYDSLLLFFVGMVLAMLVAIGLVPPIGRK